MVSILAEVGLLATRDAPVLTDGDSDQDIGRAPTTGDGSTTGRACSRHHGERVDDATIFAAGARLRREPADRLPTLSPQQLCTPSSCAGGRCAVSPGTRPPPSRWATAGWSRGRRVAGSAAHRANAELARDMAAQPLSELVDVLRGHVDVALRPPGVGVLAPLTCSCTTGRAGAVGDGPSPNWSRWLRTSSRPGERLHPALPAGWAPGWPGCRLAGLPAGRAPGWPGCAWCTDLRRARGGRTPPPNRHPVPGLGRPVP
jgi:hypothetical protein